MATTTNYGWTTPDDSSLVKDGASAIRTLGSSVDTTVKALSPGTTAGDVDYYTSSTAKARLGIGSTGQVLTVAGGVPSWATPASGSMTLLSTTSLSGSTTTVSSISGSYQNLLIRLIGARTSNVAAGIVMFRANADTGSNYNYNIFNLTGAMSTSTAQTKFNPTSPVPTTANNNMVQITIPNYANASTLKYFDTLSANASDNSVQVAFLKINSLTAAITSVTFFENDGKTFNGGTIQIYGVN
jgi:hypothetical protein